MGEQFSYGGQAVIEGVMMRGPSRIAVAVRRPDGEISIHQQEISSVLQRYPILKLPLVRGSVAMVETLGIGMKALMYSANQAMPDEEQLTKGEMTLTTIVGIVLAVGAFVVLPALVGVGGRKLGLGDVAVSSVEAVLRMGLFIGYLAAVSLMKDMQRVFQYHGAEHKVINTYEAGDPLTVEHARNHTREHKRCGTSFLLYVAVISIVLFATIAPPNFWLRVPVKLALLPLVAGVSYELLRALGKYNNRLTMLVSRPGMWLQGLTTREPDDSQIEVAIAAFETARGHGLPG